MQTDVTHAPLSGNVNATNTHYIPANAPAPALHMQPPMQGRLEMLRLGNMGLTGTVPSCLFDANSSLYQVRGRGGLAGFGGQVPPCACTLPHSPSHPNAPTHLPSGVRSCRWGTTSWRAPSQTPSPPPACSCSTWQGCAGGEGRGGDEQAVRPHTWAAHACSGAGASQEGQCCTLHGADCCCIVLTAPWMQNRLAGPIPPTLAALPNLSVLDLGNNSLSGGQLGAGRRSCLVL